MNLSANYALNNSIDASNTSTWYGGAGFMPVGIDTAQFTGSFNGSGYTITGLFINRSSTQYVGLFGYVGSGGSVSNIGLIARPRVAISAAIEMIIRGMAASMYCHPPKRMITG
jgi:hypothetical protein